MKRLLFLTVVAALSATAAYSQAARVEYSKDPTALFTDSNPELHRNKQAAMHIMRDLLEASHWDEADKWLTAKYIQHNPAFASGRDTVVKAFSSFSKPSPIPADDAWKTHVVAVVAEGDKVIVAVEREFPDPRNPGQTYTTTWFDMWRFVDGKADEHWDYGLINAPAAGKGKGKGKGK